MKTLKKILLGIVALIALLLIVALFVPRDFYSEKEVIINKPKKEVFSYVKNIKNQEEYGVWYKMDPDMERTYSGDDGTVGFVYEWDGKKIGKGKQILTNIAEGEKIESELFFDGSEDAAKAWLTTAEKSPNETIVKWGIDGKMPYPFNLMNLFMDMGDDLEEGLINLKDILESQPSIVVGSKEFLIDYFNQTTENLQKSVAGLSEAQLQFKPAEDKWSVSQCLEHIVASEKMLFGMAVKEMEKPAQPELISEVKFSDEELIAALTDRSEKFQAPEELLGPGHYTDPETAIEDLIGARKPVLEYIQSASLEDLRNHVIDYPTGKADGYQNLLFIAAHTARHTLQIEEVKSDPGFPEN